MTCINVAEFVLISELEKHHSKSCIIQIKKKNEPFAFEKRNIKSLVLSLCFS